VHAAKPQENQRPQSGLVRLRGGEGPRKLVPPLKRAGVLPLNRGKVRGRLERTGGLRRAIHPLKCDDEIVDAVALVGAEDQRRARILGDVEPGRRARKRGAVGAHKLDAHIGACGRALRQMDPQVADLLRSQAPFGRPVGSPLRESRAWRDRTNGDDASRREHIDGTDGDVEGNVLSGPSLKPSRHL
jgi:hypothetical protein